ncbi:MAG: hypothetical protein HY096_09800 [Nitrospinae bacterium]|nr:hypothetical protein [Nitrospinota bacterium]
MSQLSLDFESSLTHEERQILCLIRKGRANALSVRYLAGMTSFKEVEVRQMIRHLIMEHEALIASSVGNPPGFYIAETEGEVREATRSLRHRGISILERAAKLQKISLEDIFYQSRLEFQNALDQK